MIVIATDTKQRDSVVVIRGLNESRHPYAPNREKGEAEMINKQMYIIIQNTEHVWLKN